jgi:hypothetical protein
VTGENARGRGRRADRTGGAGGPQDDAVALRLGVAALAGLALLGIGAGGQVTGRLPPERGAAAFAAAIVVAGALAAAALWRGRRDAWRGPAALGVGAMAGLVGWSALSITWASAPDLAWLATNRLMLALWALVLGLAIARRVADPATRLAVGVSVAAMPVLVWALGSRVVPDLLAPFQDTSRLTAPIGHANGLALVAVMAVPGALLLAAPGRFRPVAVAMLTVALVVLPLTGSRSGMLALVVAVALGLWLLPHRAQSVSALVAAIAGAVPAVWFGLTAGPLTDGPLLPAPSERRGAGLILGLLVVLGVAGAVVVADLAPGRADRAARLLGRRRIAITLLVAVAALVVAGGVVAAVGTGGAPTSADRLTSLDANHRTEWWGQAVRGFASAPVHGHGAGSFPLTNVAERADSFEALRTRHVHQAALETMTELGLVGLALGLACLGAVAWAARRAGRAGWPAVCVAAPFLVQAQLDVPWTIPALAVPAMAAAGTLLALGSPAARTARAGTARAVAATALAAVAAVSAIVPAVAADRAGDAYLTADPSSASAARAGEAADLNPLAIGALLVEARIRAEIGDGPGAARAASRAARRQPGNPFAWECLAAVGDPAQAADAAARVARLNPRRDPALALACRPSW